VKIWPITHLSRLPVCATAHSPALCLRLYASEAASGPSRRLAAPPHRPPQLPSPAAPPGRPPTAPPRRPAPTTPLRLRGSARSHIGTSQSRQSGVRAVARQRRPAQQAAPQLATPAGAAAVRPSPGPGDLDPGGLRLSWKHTHCLSAW